MLSFIFTEDAFRIDHPEEILSPEEESLKASFLENRYKALFQLGFQSAGKKESPGLGFLRTLSRCFLKALTDRPDLEVARDEIEVDLPEEDYERLILSVPFVIGSEYINRAWIALQIMKMNAVFTSAIRLYDGSVGLFLTEKSQNIRIPERVFFHLVENPKDEMAPFAFLATYSTRDTDGRVRHMPLSYALEEYRQDREHLLVLLSCLGKLRKCRRFWLLLWNPARCFIRLSLPPTKLMNF